MKKLVKESFEWIVFLGLLYFIGYSMFHSGYIEKPEFETNNEKFLAIIGLIVMVHLVLMVHELGHLLVGLFYDFRFDLFVVGILGIKREDERVKFYFNKNLSHYGGLAATSPINDADDNAKKFAHILLAGPIASLVFALICFAFSFSPNPIIKFIFVLGTLTSIAIFLATTIPAKTGIFFTDRKRFQRLTKPGKDREVEIALLNIMGKYGKENSFKNINYRDIELLSSDEDPLMKILGLSNAICYQIEMARQVKEDTLIKYELAKEKISKKFSVLLDNEIEKFKLKVKAGS